MEDSEYEIENVNYEILERWVIIMIKSNFSKTLRIDLEVWRYVNV